MHTQVGAGAERERENPKQTPYSGWSRMPGQSEPKFTTLVLDRLSHPSARYQTFK